MRYNPPQAPWAPRLPGYALFGAFLAAAGLPLYIHAPKYYVDEYGVSLGALGLVLGLLRLLDFVQDPLLGRAARAMEAKRAATVLIAALILMLAMLGLFVVPPPITPLAWFAIMLTLVFSAFSYLTICFYAQGVSAAESLPAFGHVRLARWRETGALLGVCAAAVAPVALDGYVGFTLAFVILGFLALWAMQGQWRGVAAGAMEQFGFMPVLRDFTARRLLMVALVNAAPVAVSSTLFLFFVESRLEAPGMEGPFLLLFFLSAALGAPFWGRIAEAFGARRVLLTGMALSIVAFAFAVTLGPGDILAFALICFASGLALGADMTLLAALFARRMAEISPGASEAFGLWSFVSKFTLALAAVFLLPMLELGGFAPEGPNDPEALLLLGLLYGALPCVLKLVAIGLLITTPLETSQTERSAPT